MTVRMPLLPLSAVSAQRWLRVLLLCALFSALHGTVGAWVVKAISAEPAVQVCTPHGPQWISLGERSEGGDGVPHGAASALQPCVWAAAHVAIGTAITAPAWAVDSCPVATPTRVPPLPPQSDHARRVLLMSAMRAPPRTLG